MGSSASASVGPAEVKITLVEPANGADAKANGGGSKDVPVNAAG